MNAFLKIDDCKACHRALPWEWVPGVFLSGKPLAGTCVWRSLLINGLCPTCVADLEAQEQQAKRALALRTKLIEFLGGEKPYREFTFERFRITPENHLAYERAEHFNPGTDSLYLWGPCGVGKTHLARAIARRCFEEMLLVTILQAWQLSRKVRMKDPDQEQAAIDHFVQAEVLVLDDFGTGGDTAFSRQILQEILDARDLKDRAGLVVTSKYSLDELATKLGDDAIPSRLAGTCSVIHVRGPDGRLTIRKGIHDAVQGDHGPALGTAQR